ncbi:MAG: polysaccharide lyase 6 family protein, partial [Planctomycetaceae bacterium]
MRRLICLNVLLAMSGGLTLAAAERVVAPDDVSAAVAEARPGDVIVLQDGVWKDADLRVEAKGTAEKPMTLRAQTPGRVVLSGRLRLSGEHLVVSGLFFRDVGGQDHVIEFRTTSRDHAHHCRLTNCAIINDCAAEEAADTKWVSLYGTHNRVDHCYFAGKSNEGQTLVVWVGDGPNQHRIDHNHFGPRPELGKNGGETIRIGTSNVSLNDSRTVVEFNLFEECDGEAEIISSKSCENLFRANTFRRCAGALTLRHGHRCTVEGNWFLGEGKRRTGGVRIIGDDHLVINNYFENLTGDEARAAVSVMNGIPDTPLNGYSQVHR